MNKNFTKIKHKKFKTTKQDKNRERLESCDISSARCKKKEVRDM